MKWGIGNVKGSGGASNTMLTTTTDATENSGTYTLDLTYLSETPKVNDYVAYVNSGAITTLYKVSAIGSTNATLEKIGDIGGGGGGSQKYQHNIYISCKDGGNNITLQAMIQLTNDSNTAIESQDAIITEMKKSISTYGNYSYGIMASGGYTYSSNYYIISHAYLGAGGTTLKFTGYNCASKNNDYNGGLSGTITYKDTIIPL